MVELVIKYQPYILKQRQDIEPMLAKFSANVADSAPALNQRFCPLCIQN